MANLATGFNKKADLQTKWFKLLEESEKEQ